MGLLNREFRDVYVLGGGVVVGLQNKKCRDVYVLGRGCRPSKQRM